MMNKKMLEQIARTKCAASGMPPPPPPRPRPSASSRAGLSPLGWETCFDERVMVQGEGGDSFCLYSCKGPDSIPDTMPVGWLVHGGGLASLSFALLAAQLKKTMPLYAADLRGHGDTECSDESTLSSEQFVRDNLMLLAKVAPSRKVVFIGHSLGGAVAVRLARTYPSTMGCIVLDVVEGTALDSLRHMRRILSTRPSRFSAIEDAIEWAVSGGGWHNRESVRVSIPPQLRRSGEHFVWRTNLLDTEPYWEGWFKGLTSEFISTPCPKLLCIAGPDRLDRDMAVAHMQGRFQLQPVHDTGHYLHEDRPDEVAKIIEKFIARFTKPIPGVG